MSPRAISDTGRGPTLATGGLIHRSAWNKISANFAFWTFSEVHIQDPEYPSPSGRCQALRPLALPHPDSLGIAQDSFCPSGA
jgi:hypothetical protein